MSSINSIKAPLVSVFLCMYSFLLVLFQLLHYMCCVTMSKLTGRRKRKKEGWRKHNKRVA